MKLKSIFGILTIILLIMCVLSAGIKNTSVGVDESNYTNSTDVGHFSEGTAVEYRFKATGETIEGYGFLFATYGEELSKGRVCMNIYDSDTGKVIADGYIRADTIEDNKINIIKTKRINLGRRNIRVILYCEDFEPDELMTLWLGENSENGEGETFVNGIPLENNLLIFGNKVTKEALYTWDVALLASLSFVVFCSIPVYKKEDRLGGNDGLEEKVTEA